METRLNGCTIRGELRDGASPAFLFVHGWGCGRADWKGQLAAPDAKHRMLAIDLPGHGASDAPTAATVNDFSAAVGAVAAEHGRGPVILVGHSLGCRVVSQACADFPDRVAGVIFVDGSLTVTGDPEPVIARMRGQIETGGFTAFVDQMYETMLPRVDAAEQERMMRQAHSTDPRCGASVMVDALRWDALRSANTLAKITKPTLLLQSSIYGEDFIRHSLTPGMTTPWTRLVQAQIPGARLEIIQGVGHWPHIEATRELNAHLWKFADTLGS